MFQTSTPTQYFWYRTTLMVSEDINSPEAFNWKIALTLMVAWVLVYMCMIKGIASSGKVNSYILLWIYTMCSNSNKMPRLKNHHQESFKKDNTIIVIIIVISMMIVVVVVVVVVIVVVVVVVVVAVVAASAVVLIVGFQYLNMW
jgi:hypothetical protein